MSARLIEIANDVAARSAATYNMVHMADDIAGDLLEHYVKHADHFAVLENEGQEDLIRHEFYRRAYLICHKETVRSGYENGSTFYSPEYVRLFIPFLFAYEDWADGPKDEIQSAKWRTGEAIDTAIDLTRSFKRLKPAEQAVIMARHDNPPKVGDTADICWATIAERVGRSSARAAEVAYQRATEAWARVANGSRDSRSAEHDGTGARRPLTAAQGRNLVAST